MFFIPKFFYDDNATDGAGGNADNTTTTTDDKKTTTVDTTVDVLKPLFSDEEIKGFGFDNLDQMKAHLQQTRESRVPDEQKKKAAELDKADFINVSTKEGLLTVDEFTAYESVTKKSDRDLVYEKFVTDFKEDNPDATDELIRTEFESEYKLDSKNDKTKTRGEARMKREADEMRFPLVEKYTEAKSFHDNYKNGQKEQPVFYKFIDDLVQALTPETLNIAKAKDGEDEIEIPVTFTKEQREEIAKLFRTPKIYGEYLKNKDKLAETLSPSLTKKINSIIKVNNFDTAVNYAFKTAKGIAIKQGSTTGAEQPYGVVKNMPKMNIDKTVQQTLDESDRAFRQKHANK